MSISAMFGVFATLGFVLVLLGIALKLLRRFAPMSGGGSRLRMEIVQRLALGPKQGIAVVRIGARLVAVSVGDGGVNRLFELEESEVRAADVAPSPSLPSKGSIDFQSIMRGALKTSGLALALAVTLPVAGRTLAAQARTQARTQAPATRPDVAARVRDLAKAASSAPSTTTRSLLDAPVSKLAPQLDLRVGGGDSGGLRLSGTVGVVVMMGLLTLLPTLLLMMTGFTRILIVLNFLRQAIGTQTAPPTQLVAGLALLLTGFVMAPTLSEVNRTALQPWLDGKMEQAQMLDVGARPFRAFMVRQTRRQDIATFVRMSGGPSPATINDVPLVTLTSAFVISELRTAFQLGFALFLPFIVIDVVVSSVLMSMGMFMLPPAMISLPFKLLLFVLVDGWSLIVQSLITSFR